MQKIESRNSPDVATLVQEHDCLLLDLDGTVFRGHQATVGAVDTLAAVTSRKLYVTNNASRASEEVAAHLRAMGFTADADDVVASAQGHSPETAWPDLAEAALAIRGGALWVAANVDKTLPSERGLLPGNGAMVAALRAATDSEPQVAGKPEAAVLTDALARGTFRTPLVVGDRLDTDIAGANAAGLPSLLV